jgi:hypothetical protein
MQLPSNTDLINLCAQIYSDDIGAKDWDHLDLGVDDGVFWAVKKFTDCIAIVFRGSTTVGDWIHDFLAAPVLTELGWVHGGFYLGTDKMWSELRTMLTPGVPVAVAGHSLGASHANICCGHMIKAGIIPAKRVVVGEPKPGMQDFCGKLKVIPSSLSFVNGSGHRHDLVTDVPFSIPPALPFTRPTPLIPVTAMPTGNVWERDVDPFAWHHVQLYQAAVAAYDQSQQKVAAA